MVFDKDGVLEHICTGKGYIDMSTVDADTSSKISEVWISIFWPFFVWSKSVNLEPLLVDDRSNSSCLVKGV